MKNVFGNKKSSFAQRFFFDKLTEGLFFSSAGLILGRLASFATRIILARLGVVNFGIYNLTLAIFSTMVMLFAFGMPMAVTRYTSFYLGKKQFRKTKDIYLTTITTLLPLAILFSIIFFLLAPKILPLFNKQIPAHFVQITIFIMPIAVIALLNRAVFLGFLKIKYVFFMENLELLFRLLFIALFIFFGWRLWGGIIGYILAVVSVFILSSIAVIKLLNLKDFKFKYFKELLRFSWPVSLSEILSAVANNADLLILGWLFGATAVGLYSATLALSSLVLIFPRLVLPYFLPVISHLHGQYKKITVAYKTMFYWLLIAIIPTAIIIIFIGKEMAKIFFGKEYEINFGVLLFLTLANLIFGLFIWPGRQVIDMRKWTKKNLNLTILRVAVLVTLWSLLIPKWGGLGAAIALFIAWLVEATWCMILVKKILCK